MDGPASVFLVGPMGAGKSSVGRRLARLLGLDFVDADEVVAREAGMDIPAIFAAEGEAGFRAREREVIDRLTRLPGIVLATGGGAVMDPANRACLLTRGHVVYLYADVETQHARTRRSRHRPLLQTEDPRARLAELFARRDPLYREVADFVVDTRGGGVEDTVRAVLAQLRATGEFRRRRGVGRRRREGRRERP
ncbi:shikimate kinase [Inmirania thermothiophila]|uniref:Shikimate kinase n=1 Tax=Inmirania thermothiophila TaxID=1750597 RepID=A0A3N1Y5M8_9GAMM|nr:shikimate kinase [Inmirania thermothiophila]ROR34119.1 shikimate kinase [Inmirania thermothiophila]